MAVYKEHILARYDDGEIIETRREAKVWRGAVENDVHVTDRYDPSNVLGEPRLIYFRKKDMGVDQEICISLEDLERVIAFFKLPPLEVNE